MKPERIGLVVVLASLAAIAAIVILVFQFQAGDRIADIRRQGGRLVRALAAMPNSLRDSAGEQQRDSGVL